MTLIKKLGDEKERDLLQSKYNELKDITFDELDSINNYLQACIREKLENIGSTDYLNPLQGFTSEYPIKSLKDFVSEHPLKYSH